MKGQFPSWLKETFPEWKWNWKYQRYLYERLDRVTKGRSKRLMIFMPPRHGKSETVTVRYTAWRLLQDPKLNVILGSYNQKLADRFSRKIRRIVDSGKLIVDSSNGEDANSPLSIINSQLHRVTAVSEWETPAGGCVRSVGVGGGVAGFGAGLIVIDDPVRNRADAESETYRERVWDWFNDDIYTRLEPNGAIILIQTRWHEDDLAGRLLKEAEDGGEKWEVVKLPALGVEDNFTTETQRRREKKSNKGGISVSSCNFVVNEIETTKRHEETRNKNSSPCLRASVVDVLGRKPGEALCPKRFDVKALERIRKKIGSYSFSALYQQEPVPTSGGSFKREWFRQVVDSPPPNLRWKRGYDLAISTKTSADYTASFRCAFDKMGNLYIADGFRKRIEYPEQRRFIIERTQNEPNTEHGIEAAMHGKAVVQELRRDRSLRRFAFREVRVEADKLTRALAWLNLAEAGKVFLVRGPWIDDFIDEVCRFPSGRFDDQVDAVSIAVSMLSKPMKVSAGF
jgi:predicted phage terminase large subunit-like protein